MVYLHILRKPENKMDFCFLSYLVYFFHRPLKSTNTYKTKSYMETNRLSTIRFRKIIHFVV